MKPIAVGTETGIRVPRTFEPENTGFMLFIEQKPNQAPRVIETLYTQEYAETISYRDRFVYSKKGEKKTITISENVNYFVTTNPKINPARSWTQENTLAISNIFIDIDLRKKELKNKENGKLLLEMAEKLQKYLFKEFKKRGVPVPTEAIFSGSGLHIVWHTRQDVYNEVFKNIYRSRTLGIAEEVQSIIDSDYKLSAMYEVDTTASTNFSGLRRAYVGYNTRTGNRIRALEINKTNYTIDTFKAYGKPIKKATKKTTTKAKYISKRYATSEELPTDEATARMHLAREKACYKAIDIFNESGKREGGRYNIVFNLYNILIQKYNYDHERAFKETAEANKKFNYPLSEQELRSKLKIKNGVGYYKMTNETFYGRLGVTQEELGIGTTSRELERREKRLQKQQRDELVVKLYNEGVIIKDIVNQVTEATGRTWSRRTITNIISKEAKKGNVKKRIPNNPTKR